MLISINFRQPFIISNTIVSASYSCCVSLVVIWLYVAPTAAVHLRPVEVQFFIFCNPAGFILESIRFLYTNYIGFVLFNYF